MAGEVCFAPLPHRREVTIYSHHEGGHVRFRSTGFGVDGNGPTDMVLGGVAVCFTSNPLTWLAGNMSNQAPFDEMPTVLQFLPTIASLRSWDLKDGPRRCKIEQRSDQHPSISITSKSTEAHAAYSDLEVYTVRQMFCRK